MMVMADVCEGEASLHSLLSVLESKTTRNEDRLEVYSTFSKQLKEKDLSFLSLDVTEYGQRVVNLTVNDLQNSSEEIKQGALHILGFCMFDKEITISLSSAVTKDVIQSICDLVVKTEDKTTCTRALWCLSRQNLDAGAVREKVGAITEAIVDALTRWQQQAVTVEHEAVSVMARMFEQIPKCMKDNVVHWIKAICPLIVYGATKVREKAFTVLETAEDAILKHPKEICPLISSLISTKIAPELKKLFASKNELYVLKVWEFLVKMFGPELHQGVFINTLLPIVELGFKNSVPEIKAASFKAWEVLINNFAANPGVIGNPKRVKLIMQVFKLSNAKTEHVALTKLGSWWHFVRQLDTKLSLHFDQVCVPLLQFCIGGSNKAGQSSMSTPLSGAGQLLTSPVTSRLNLPTPVSPFPKFLSLQKRGCEVLALILATSNVQAELPEYHFTLESLNQPAIAGPAMFLKQAPLLISCATDLICSQGETVEDSLLVEIWQFLVTHLKNSLDAGSNSDCRDALTMFLTQFQVMVLSQTLRQELVMKLFQSVCNLPKKALSSTAYNISSGEVVGGTPALFLTGALLTPKLLHVSGSSENFLSLFYTLLECGISNPSGVLDFCNNVLVILDLNAEFFENREVLWRFWSALVDHLRDHIIKSNEVNQGDVLEHDFSCMYAAVLFPITKILHQDLSQPTTKAVLKYWGELYRTFARLSALVTNVQANITCETLCEKILTKVTMDMIENVYFLESLVTIFHIIIEAVDFSSLSSQSLLNPATALSPIKWIKEKQKPMEKLHSFVLLVRRSLIAFVKLVNIDDDTIIDMSKAKQQRPPHTLLSGIIAGIVGALNRLFCHVTQPNIIMHMIGHLARPLSDLYAASARRGYAPKVFTIAFGNRLEKLWLDICTCIQGRYNGLYDSEFLAIMSPLLETMFLYPKRQIKIQTSVLWNATFSKSAPLVYPEALVAVLVKVKEKTTILLPGWISTNISVISETPASQFSQSDSDAPVPRLPGFPSPQKMLGSFINKAISPNIKKSPAKSPVKPDVKQTSSAKKKIFSVNDMSDKDFVLISASPASSKKRILTEHQKELMTERKMLPVMYTNLDQSQDRSLMSQFNTDTQEPATMSQDSVTIIEPEEKPFEIPADLSDGMLPIIVHKRSPRRQKSKSVRFQDTEAPAQSTEPIIITDSEGKTSDPSTSSSMDVDANENNQDKPNQDANVTNSVSTSNGISMEVTTPSIEKSPLRQNLLHAMEADVLAESGSSGKSDTISCSSSGKESSLTEKQASVSPKKRGRPKKSRSTARQNLFETLEGDLQSQSIDISESASSDHDEKESPTVDKQPAASSKKRGRPRKYLSQPPSLPKAPVTLEKNSVSQDPNAKEKPAAPAFDLQKWLIKSDRKAEASDSFQKVQTPAKPSETFLSSLKEDSKFENGLSDASEALILLSTSLVEETQSPKKLSDSKTLVVPVIEETQSPTDMTKIGKDASCQDTHKQSVVVTPEKDVVDRQTVEVTGRKLFNDDVLECSQDVDIIPGTPPKQSASGIGLSARSFALSPVLKLKKLSNEDIKLYSPKKYPRNSSDQDENLNCEKVPSIAEDEESKMDPVFDDMPTITPMDTSHDGLAESQGFPTLVSESPDIIPSSQIESPKTKRKLKKVEKTSLSPEDVASQAKMSQSLLIQTSVDKETPQSISLPSPVGDISSTADSVIIKDVDSSKEYDPGLVGTFKESQEIPAGQSVFISPSKTIETQSENSSIHLESETKSSEEAMITETPEDYNHLLVSTLDEKLEKSGPKTKSKTKKLEKLKPAKPKRKSVAASVVQAETKSTIKTRRSSMPPSSKMSEVVKLDVLENEDNKTKGVKSKPPTNCMDIISSRGDFIDDSIEQLSKSSIDVQSEHTPDMKDTPKDGKRQSTAKTKREVSKRRSLARVLSRKASDESDNLAKVLSEDETAPKEDKVVESDKLETEDKLIISSGMDCEMLEVLPESNVLFTEDSSQTDFPEDVVNIEDVPSAGESDNEECEVLSQASDSRVAKKAKYKRAKVSPMLPRLRSSGKVLRTRKGPIGAVSPKQKKRQLVKRANQGTDNRAKTDSVVAKKGKEPVETVEAFVNTLNDVNEDDVNEDDAEKSPKSDTKTIGSPSKRASKRKKQDVVAKVCDTHNEDSSKMELIPGNDVLESMEEIPNSTTKALDTSAISALISPDVESEKQEEDIQLLTEELPETPRSSKKSTASLSLLRRNTDSKLLVHNTLMNKYRTSQSEKKSRAVRSILKGSTFRVMPSRRTLNNPPDADDGKESFHPIKVPQVYSPSASPSASILKRRRLSGDKKRNSPSPPNKRRRVSFAEPIAPETKEPIPASPLLAGTQFSTPQDKKRDSQSQSSYHSTQESELNTTEPIYPELAACQESVEKVLPKLTSSMWSRGLGQLVRARNIHTIGDLSKLSEYEIHNLPLRSPKVPLVKKVLKKFEKDYDSKKLKDARDEDNKDEEQQTSLDLVFPVERDSVPPKLVPLSDIPDPLEDEDPLPSVEEALSELSPHKDTDHMNCSMEEGMLETKEELELTVSPIKNVEIVSHDNDSQSEDTINKMETVAQGTAHDVDQTISDVCEHAIPEKLDLLKTIAAFADNYSVEDVQKLSTDDIFKLHQHLTTLNSTVVLSLKAKCQPNL